ncbi:MAG: BlaI/MecI/CopY family transcriptional regulator [Acidobacteriota bacterium]
MARNSHLQLSRRERQIMDIIYRKGRATALEVQEALEDPPSYSAVRAALRILEEKGHLKHQKDGQRYVFQPTLERGRARRTALQHLVRTFFDGSVEKLVATLLEVEGEELSEGELGRLSRLIEQARQEGR